MSTSNRKLEHLELCANQDVESHRDEHNKRRTGFDDVTLVHNALPDINIKDIDTSQELLGHKLAFPLLIASMTGGHPQTKKVNEALAIAAQEIGIGVGVGSQRAALEDPGMEDSFRVVRDAAPDAFVFGNMGVAQLKEYGVEGVRQAVDMIDANAMAIHLNFLQEAIQPEGDTDAAGGLELIEEVCKKLKTPVIVKETGAGISHKVAQKLCNAGVAAIDVGGLGGTSWAGVEVYRAQNKGDLNGESLGKLFWDWGIPTATSIIESKISVPVIATGGIRSGLDMAKSLAIGASACATALPLVRPAMKGPQEVKENLEHFLAEFKAAMFLTGSATAADLMQAQVVITGRTGRYLNERGFDTSYFARR
ncbi:MAG: type 2 isopentenyl-diphosphate Delta-isomerase [ANME-2 cluster archaeon]|nr:type 2 isopentenyl-diphosphate Delta-isomerase [ANME-2 cluster archaeon]